MDSLSLRVSWPSSGSSVIGLCIMADKKHGFCGRFNPPGLEVVYLASTHIPLVRTQSSHIAASDYRKSWEMQSGYVFRKKKKW